MREHRSIVGTVVLSSALKRPGRRRVIFGVAIVICLLLSFFPQKFRSAVTLAPSDPASLGLSGALNQLGAANSVFGNQAAVEITLRVADSRAVRDQVIDMLDLMKRRNFSTRLQAHRWLDDNISTRSMRGGIVQMETKQPDPAFAESLIQAYSEAVRQRLAIINQQQTRYKREVLKKLVRESSDDFDRAQAAYDNFRLKTRYSDPTLAIDAIGERIPVLQAAIKAKEVQLNAARQFGTDDNMIVRQIIAELAALKVQLAQQQALDPSEQNSVGRVVEQSTIANRLERNLILARSLYEVYSRYLEGTSVEDLTSNANLRIIEPPFIDTTRQLNIPFLALAMLLILFALTAEFYLMRPPLEARNA
jgi:capsule polysaccharide export protein KpsE/RkpR